MKFWVTKYALTSGIHEVEGDDPASTDFPNMLTVRSKSEAGLQQHFHGEGRDWHRTHVAALGRAERMRTDKIHSLHRSIKKLEAIRFTA